MQDEVAEIARRHGIALVGPNCMGVVDLTANSASYIGDVSPYQPRGGVAGIAQSGSVTDAFIQAGSRVGFSRIISCGSEVVLDVCDYLAYCLDDPETHSVILFVEGFKRPERFLALADRALQLGKPIMAVKVGRSDQAQAAAVAHSGSLAGETRVTDAALDAAGVIRCRDLDELLETAELVEGTRRTGRSVGRGRTGVVTVSTGEASLVADLVPTTGLDLPPIPESGAGGDPGAASDDGLHREPAGPVGRRRTGDGLRGLLRGDGGVGRLRRARPRPRLALPVDAGRGRHGERCHDAAARGHARPTGDPAGLRLVDVGRASARDQGPAATTRVGERRCCAGPSRRSARSPRWRAGRVVTRPAVPRTGDRGGRRGRRSEPIGRPSGRTRPRPVVEPTVTAPRGRCPSARASSCSVRPACR